MTPLVKSLLIGTLVLLLYAGSAIGDPSTAPKLPQALNDAGITITGTIEVEAGYADTDTQDTSDITLATVELGIDAQPVRHVSGHIVFLFEEDDTDLEVDQGFIRLDGENKCPFYAEAGRLYLPFGNYDTHFISDPLTLELGETRESALVLGYGSDVLNITLGIFNGDVNETNQSDDLIDGFSVGAVYTLPVRSKFSFSAGVAYLSNLGDSDGMTDQLTLADTIDAYVPAVAVFVSADWGEKLFCQLEYVAATESFNAGDLAFDNGNDVTPRALNVELAYAITDRLEVALRYGASDEAGDFLPESLYGVVAGYSPMDHVGIALELQTGTYEGGSDITTATLQLALEF